MIVGKIDMTKVDEARFFAGKNGAKYLDVIMIETPDSKYGDDYMICQGVTREERDKGVKGNILGNARLLEKRSGAPARRPAPPAAKPSATDGDDVPF